MDQLTVQQLETLMTMTVMVHCAMAICLFGFARMSDRNTFLWSMVGLFAGLLGMIGYIVYSIREMSNESGPRRARFNGDDDDLARHLLSQTDLQGEIDKSLEELIKEGYLEKARSQANEKMQAAFNYNDGVRETIYRRYLDRIDRLSNRTAVKVGAD